MGNKNKVIVKILGQDYTIVSDETREYIQKLSNYVDDKMVEIAEKNKKLSTAMIAVLTALNIADEYYKLLEEYEKMKYEADKPVAELQEVKEQLAVTAAEMNKVNESYEKLYDSYEKLKKASAFIEEENTSLKEELNRLNYEINIKNNKLKKADKIIEDLKNKLMMSEVKLVQTKKELQEFIETFDSSSEI